MSPRVSVLLPTCQHAATLAAAVGDVLAQTVADLELVVVDDGSTDGTGEVLARCAGSDPRVRAIRTPHRGLVAALQLAAATARGAFLARMDADDRCAPARLERQLAWLLDHPGAGATDCHVLLGESAVTGDGMRAHVDWLNSLDGPDDLRRQLFVESPLVHPACLMRREAFEAAGGYVDDGGGPEDYSLWLRMAAAGWDLGKVPEALFTWSDLPGRYTRTSPTSGRERLAALKARHLPGVYPRTREGVQVWGAGREGLRLARLLHAAGIRILRFFDVDPRKIGNRLLDAPVLPLDALEVHPSTFTLVGIGIRSAKPLVRSRMAELGRVEGKNWIFVA
ncbi:MAG: glycosyltransferase [Deltaproteobacteria bacterium]|nr:glycosyltransferase [Deltaproteobacteria bacterium]